MRQILLNSSGALVARVPAPMVEPGTVLVRVQYSLVSVGTELAGLRATAGASTAAAAVSRAKLLRRYVSAAIADPKRAVKIASAMAGRAVAERLPRRTLEPVKAADLAGMVWERGAAAEFAVESGALTFRSDDSAGSYQVVSQPLAVTPGCVPVIDVKGEVVEGRIAIGLLDETKASWLGMRTYEEGPLEDRIAFDPRGSASVTLVFSAANRPGTRVRVDGLDVVNMDAASLGPSELDQQGWGVGYSAAGEVLAVGAGVTDLAPGDLVACAGAGQANHADIISVRRNLVCALPPGCSTKAAASTTVGTIALQGVRRAKPQLGDRVCVLGLGLIGQITAQLLKASGCRVVGLDLDPTRVARAKALGLEHGASSPDELKKLLRDVTGGRGADSTLITAATKSDAVINLAMEVTRPKGTVVIVGDIGLNVERAQFYRKEIDLLMSTSYGPGRYDASYEQEGRDYPYGYVRWTSNRNMQAYLEQIASGGVNFDALIDRVVPVEEAPAAYAELAANSASSPMGVLITYGGVEATDDTRITVRGHRKAPSSGIRYALVGAGAFGTSMLVPQMARCQGRYFLRGVVSRDAVRGGNFARSNQVEVLSTDLGTVLADPQFDLVVIATRHHEHASACARALGAGKHVFVEKPLALTWDELETVIAAYEAGDAQLMVGYNRRFSPAVTELRKAVSGRRSPLIMNYRLNAGYAPMDSWLHGPEGGGRNLGEACHMYDVFRSLAGQPAASVSATAIAPGSLPYKRNDNFVATVGYADGTVGTLVYTALGPKEGLAKERLEVFCDGECYLLDDYKKLTRMSDQAVLWQGETVDKGHFEELRQLGEALLAGTAPIPFAELVETSAVALRVEQELFGTTEG